MSVPSLLDKFVEYDREERRKGHSAAITQSGFARKLVKGIGTVKGYLADANLPWPPVSPGDLVLLLDDAPPHELHWISDAWCELTGQQRDDLRFKPAAYLREFGIADGPREMHHAIARQLREGPSEGSVDGWICDREHQRRLARFDLRYGRRANTFYVRAHLLETHDAEVFNVVPGLIVKPRRNGGLDQVDLIELERLIIAALPDYKPPVN